MTLAEIYSMGDVVLTTAAAAAALFLLAYTVLARWWESREGWYLWVSSVVFTALLIYNLGIVMGWVWADPVVRAWCRVAIYASCAVVMVWRLVLLVMAQFSSQAIVLAQIPPGTLYRREK